MATRQQKNPVRPSSPQAPRNRSDFQPESQWTDEAAASVLTIMLPGFNKDQLKITFDETTRNLRVQGERRLPNNNNNNWLSRFNSDFKIPENCKLNEMKAKFDQNQVLTITMPKKTAASVTAIGVPVKATTTTTISDHQKPRQDVTTTTTRPPQRPSSSVETDHLLPSPKKLKEETARKDTTPPAEPVMKKPEDEKRAPTSTWRDPLGHIKSPQDTYAPPKPKATTNASNNNNNNNKKTSSSIGKQKVEEALQPPSTSQEQQLSEAKSQKDVAEYPPSNYNDDQITSKLPGPSNNKANINVGKSTTDEPMMRRTAPRIAAGGSVDEPQKEKEKNKVKAVDDQSPSSMFAAGVGGGSFHEKTGDLAAVAKRAVLGLDVERRLLVNTGVAVLVITALGVYVSYKFGSSSEKRKD